MESESMKRRKLAWSIGIGAALIIVGGVASSQDMSDAEIIGKVAERVASYPELRNMEVRAVSTMVEMDKQWKPKKEIVVEKIMRMNDGLRSEEILSARQTEKGNTKDVTAEHAQEARKRAEKARRRREERGRDADEEDSGGRRDLSMEQMFPFGEDKRTQYDFVRRNDSYVGRRTVYVLEAKARIRSDKWIEGLYYIDKKTFDVLQAEVHFAKNPRAVKRFEMEAQFQVLPQGYLVLARSRVRIHVGLVIKNIRMQAEETYSDYRISDERF
jgi:hypothetical protein